MKKVMFLWICQGSTLPCSNGRYQEGAKNVGGKRGSTVVNRCQPKSLKNGWDFIIRAILSPKKIGCWDLGGFSA